MCAAADAVLSSVRLCGVNLRQKAWEIWQRRRNLDSSVWCNVVWLVRLMITKAGWHFFRVINQPLKALIKPWMHSLAYQVAFFVELQFPETNIFRLRYRRQRVSSCLKNAWEASSSKITPHGEDGLINFCIFYRHPQHMWEHLSCANACNFMHYEWLLLVRMSAWNFIDWRSFGMFAYDKLWYEIYWGLFAMLRARSISFNLLDFIMH